MSFWNVYSLSCHLTLGNCVRVYFSVSINGWKEEKNPPYIAWKLQLLDLLRWYGTTDLQTWRRQRERRKSAENLLKTLVSLSLLQHGIVWLNAQDDSAFVRVWNIYKTSSVWWSTDQGRGGGRHTAHTRSTWFGCVDISKFSLSASNNYHPH